MGWHGIPALERVRARILTGDLMIVIGTTGALAAAAAMLLASANVEVIELRAQQTSTERYVEYISRYGYALEPASLWAKIPKEAEYTDPAPRKETAPRVAHVMSRDARPNAGSPGKMDYG
jgi:hypothetical protein